MNIFSKILKIAMKPFISLLSAAFTLSFTHLAYAGLPHQEPLFLTAKVTPIMMLNMSKDHQLYFKLYDDYSDIDNDTKKTPDRTYMHSYDYYGYFDNNKCYSYDSTNGLFIPESPTNDKYCDEASTHWSGNFLNWATMTRMDAVRKILYGGYRSTDTADLTVLERAFLPNDAHSFAKYYEGADLRKLTPFSIDPLEADAKKKGITLCNTSEPKDRTYFSQGKWDDGKKVFVPDDKPLIRVAKGNYSLWASNERWQCRWKSQATENNSNNENTSKIYAYSSNPIDNAADSVNNTKLGEYIARVAVCVTGMIDEKNNEKCQSYGTSGTVYKPDGLLQAWGDDDKLHFGLMTGSYAKNKSGGVLRKQISSFTDEIDSNGIFTFPTYSIVKTINSLRIYGYDFNKGTYSDGSYSDNCKLEIRSFKNGDCTNWGNPQAEIYLEALRYISGAKTPSDAFEADDSGRIAGLNQLTSWGDPITSEDSGNYCAPISILQFNASTTSHDADELDGASDVGIDDLTAVTDGIGVSEGITGNTFFIGQNGSSEGTASHEVCTAKTITSFSSALGICPEAPTVKGSYQIAGLAHKARTTKISDPRGKYIQTYGVDLAPNIPSLTIPVPDSERVVNILPACINNRMTTTVNGKTGQPEQREGNCTIVDYKVVDFKEETTTENNVTTKRNIAKLYVNWEAAEQGFDFDQDMWGMIDVSVSSFTVNVTTQVMAQSSGAPMAFGYVISGTTTDGFKVHSGINKFKQSDTFCETDLDCTCRASGNGACDLSPASLKTYDITTSNSNAGVLRTPMYYAAKYGGYDEDKKDDTDPVEELDIALAPEKYFKVTDPRALEAALDDAMAKTARQVASSATVAANSTRLNGETKVYQARFNSEDWSGQILAFPLKMDGSVDESDADWTTDDTGVIPTKYTERNIYTYDGSTKTRVKVSASAWDDGSIPTLKSYMDLPGDSDTTAKERLLWVMGDRSKENPGEFRDRTKLLGDVVNSDPAYAGVNNQRYENLPVEYGSASYQAYVSDKSTWKRAIFVGSNDGMMHAFQDGNGSGAELFAYIPRGAYPKLANLTKRNYQHEYIVDGPMYVGDVYFDSDTDGVGGQWKTIVVGTMGAGGKGIYALDVTEVLKSGKEPVVLFDYTEFDLVSTTVGDLTSGDMGFITSKVLIAPTADGGWHAIFGNGRQSGGGYSKLIAINIEKPTEIEVINTGARYSSTNLDNGLSGVALLPDANGVVQYAYAGDMMGNMWKFDLTNTKPDSWNNPFSPSPLIKVLNADGQEQSIVSAPTLGLNNKKLIKIGNDQVPSTMVYFGTGKYDESTDISSTSVQSIYGIADARKAISLTVSERKTLLQEKVITQPSSTVRNVSNDKTIPGGQPQVDWDGTQTDTEKHGWFVDLQVGSNQRGERVISKPLLMFDRLLVNTFIPSSNKCDFGGVGWLMELTGVGDMFIGHTVLGNTYLEMPIIGDLIPILAGEKVVIVGSGLGKEELDPPISTFIGDAAAGTRGRMSWRQIK